jgi:16S rRNA (adenine1518-N6/adenine1519-N6)-dimethyltransferase
MSFQVKKRFGQNFLKDEAIINQIISSVNPKSDDFIVEIGPGFGAITTPLLKLVDSLNLIELDRDIVSYIQAKAHPKINLYAADALKFDYSTFKTSSMRIIGNLPYNISTPLLFHLAQYPNIKDMHFMLQQEVVDRICAKPNCGDYGRLSIMLQYKFNCYKLFNVSKTCFTPQPKVESAIIRLIPKTSEQIVAVSAKILNMVVTQAFSQRRKTIANSLKSTVSKDIFTQLDIDTQKRAENLSVDDYVRLATNIQNNLDK